MKSLSSDIPKEEEDLAMDRSCWQKLIDWNFDPNDVSQETAEWYNSPLLQASNINYGKRKSRPMIIFAQLGDLSMLRHISFLTSSQNVFNLTDEHDLFPLYTAISEPHSEEHILKVCKWLYAHGANLHQTVGEEWSCLSRACLKGFGKVALWLVQSGALLSSNREMGSPSFATYIARRDLPSRGMYCGLAEAGAVRTRRIHCEIFSWAKEIVATRDAFLWFLRGTLPPPVVTEDLQLAVAQRLYVHAQICAKQREMAALLVSMLQEIPRTKLEAFYEMTLSPLRLLNGHPGILEHIGSYVGVETKRNILCSARGLVNHEVWWSMSFSEKDE